MNSKALTNFRYQPVGGTALNFDNSKAYAYYDTGSGIQLVVYSFAPPTFTSTSPSNGFRVGNSNVTYTLDQDLSEGTITWTATGGTDPISHSINLVTDTKHTTGTHTVTG